MARGRGGAVRNINPKQEARKEMFTGVEASRVVCAGCEESFKRTALRPLAPGLDGFCFSCRGMVTSLLEPLMTRDDLDRYYMRQYGITFKIYAQMFMRQHGRCAICRETPKSRQLVVDHCHETERVRGLLCGICNSGLGMFKDSVPSLARAIVYLST